MFTLSSCTSSQASRLLLPREMKGPTWPRGKARAGAGISGPRFAHSTTCHTLTSALVTSASSRPRFAHPTTCHTLTSALVTPASGRPRFAHPTTCHTLTSALVAPASTLRNTDPFQHCPAYQDIRGQTWGSCGDRWSPW